MRLLLTAALLFLSGALCAQDKADQPPIETSQAFGSYEVYYSVFPSTMLTESVAGAYRIVRAKDRAVVNVTVRKKLAAGGDEPHSAAVTGSASDLMQSRKLDFREIRETGAIYYIAELRHTDRELLRFDIKVLTDPDSPPKVITFTRKLYIDQ